jgi:hypothetical protein
MRCWPQRSGEWAVMVLSEGEMEKQACITQVHVLLAAEEW